MSPSEDNRLPLERLTVMAAAEIDTPPRDPPSTTTPGCGPLPSGSSRTPTSPLSPTSRRVPCRRPPYRRGPDTHGYLARRKPRASS
jgi:hypothetical protein